MQITNHFTDDHCPCIKFNHKGRTFELLWTSHEVVAALEYCEESKKARKSIQPLLNMINNPDDIVNEDDNPEWEKWITAYTEYGCLKVNRIEVIK